MKSKELKSLKVSCCFSDRQIGKLRKLSWVEGMPLSEVVRAILFEGTNIESVGKVIEPDTGKTSGRKDFRVIIYVTRDQRKELESSARSYGIGLSRFIRFSIFHPKVLKALKGLDVAGLDDRFLSSDDAIRSGGSKKSSEAHRNKIMVSLSGVERAAACAIAEGLGECVGTWLREELIRWRNDGEVRHEEAKDYGFELSFEDAANTQVSLLVKDSQHIRILRRANEHGLSISAYIRMFLFYPGELIKRLRGASRL